MDKTILIVGQAPPRGLKRSKHMKAAFLERTGKSVSNIRTRRISLEVSPSRGEVAHIC